MAPMPAMAFSSDRGAGKRRDRQPRARRERPPPRPIGRARLEEMALAYVARFATSAGKLEAYLKRKVRERGWDGAEDEDTTAVAGEAIEDIVTRFVEVGYVDDEGFAHGRSRSLTGRGFGPRRVDAALREAGIADDLRNAARPDAQRQRQAALDLARKRGFGPFDRSAAPPEDARPSYEVLAQIRAIQEKQLAAMLRAGHSFDIARAVLGFATEAEAERWVEEAEDEA